MKNVLKILQKAEWDTQTDALKMLEFYWEQRGVPVDKHDIGLRFGGDMVRATTSQDPKYDLDGRLHRFYLACCRRIWPLLPQEASRKGVEMAEQFLIGEVSASELTKYNWNVEGAAFLIDYNTNPEKIAEWVADVQAMSESQLKSILTLTNDKLHLDPKTLLKRAAYFADYAMVYPSFRKGPPPPNYGIFMCPKLLRQCIEYPG